MNVLAATKCPEDIPDCSGILDFNLTLVVQLAVFVITVVVLWQLVWKPLLTVIDAREVRISAGRRAAEETDRLIEGTAVEVRQILDEARTVARAALDEARRGANAEAEALRRRAHQEAQAVLAAALQDIAGERESAIRDLRRQTEVLVVAAASRLLGSDLDTARHGDLIREALGR